MNIDQSKAIPLADFLSRLGYEPESRKHGQLWYKSPLRVENTPSFKINTHLNAFYDFATGDHGDIIDFISQHDHLGSLPEALKRITEIMGANYEPVERTRVAASKPIGTTLTLDRTGPIAAKALKAYLRQRGISEAVARKEVLECTTALKIARSML